MTPNKEKALAALLTEPTKGDAAKAAGISRRTLSKYLQDEDFKRAYNEAFESLIADATRVAQGSLSPAMVTLRQIMEDKKVNAAVRVQAARSILEYGMKLNEQYDIIERLKRLEEANETRYY